MAIKRPRACVSRFARAIESELRAHDNDPGRSRHGWRRATLQRLFARLVEEVGEVGMAVESGSTVGEVMSEAADVGAFAMMLWDVAGLLREGRVMSGKRNPHYDTKPVHKAAQVSSRGSVSAMCFKSPRGINPKRASWSLRWPGVTCPKCLKMKDEGVE